MKTMMVMTMTMMIMMKKQGLAYLGEYPLAWSACLCNETIYNLLVEEGADPNHQVIIIIIMRHFIICF